MRKLITIFILVLILGQLSYGQKRKTPKDIKEAITRLQTDCSDSLKNIIVETKDSYLFQLCYPWKGDYRTIYDWTSSKNKRSVLRKYLINRGISNNKHQQSIILIAFKKSLIGVNVNEIEIIEPFKKIENNWANEDLVRYTTDTIRGVYIPKDLEDCFRRINEFWADSTKTEIKSWTEDEFTGRTHIGFGRWMRNNWQLWGGSRLSKYFNEKGVSHPDDMTGIILDSYHRHLNGKEIALEKQIEYYQIYWKVNSAPSKDIYPKGSRKLEFDMVILYTLNENNMPGCVHIQSNSKSNKVWIYDFHFGWKQLTKDELYKLKSTAYEIREKALIKIFNKE
ncbi:DUF6794 domain-containing protein [Marinifilum flexuosum]|uniref:DUF6794 domain-containing protein n=1 Tax=Marinifilum flexuosum TaxID=1117708 RepID=UPI002490F8E2|nr:DUF6794 domain-containing protein [Marinifilum flexuosum]